MVAFEGDASQVLRSPEALDDLADGVVVIDEESDAGGSMVDGDVITVIDQNGSTVTRDGEPVELTVAVAEAGALAYVTPATLAELAPEVAVNSIWMRISDDADAIDVATGVQQALNDVGAADPGAPVLSVGGAAIERAAFGQVIDTMLSVVLGLLAVAVVIALVGVANTLSLSVIERRRENAHAASDGSDPGAAARHAGGRGCADRGPRRRAGGGRRARVRLGRGGDRARWRRWWRRRAARGAVAAARLRSPSWRWPRGCSPRCCRRAAPCGSPRSRHSRPTRIGLRSDRLPDRFVHRRTAGGRLTPAA